MQVLRYSPDDGVHASQGSATIRQEGNTSYIQRPKLAGRDRRLQLLSSKQVSDPSQTISGGTLEEENRKSDA